MKYKVTVNYIDCQLDLGAYDNELEARTVAYKHAMQTIFERLADLINDELNDYYDIEETEK